MAMYDKDAELVRRGLEHMLAVSATAKLPESGEWQLPKPMHLGSRDPFADPDWRMKLHLRDGAVAETPATYGAVRCDRKS